MATATPLSDSGAATDAPLLLRDGEDPTELLLEPSPSPSASTSSSSASETPSLPDKRERERALAAKRRRAYNARAKSELALLKHQEGELAATLRQLKGRLERRHRGGAGGATLSVPKWRGIAILQMEQRLAAEALNEKLRYRVEGQSRVIRELYSVLQRLQMGEANSDAVVHRDVGGPVRLELADTLLFETYLKELDVMYAMTDGVFRECGLDLDQEKPVVTHCPWEKWDAESESEYWECAGVALISLPYHEARLTLWPVNHFFHARQEQRQFYRGVGDPDNTLATKFRVHYRSQAPAAAIPLIGRMVMRRYHEAGRTVLVWRTLYDGEGAFAGMHSDETGWCIVRPTTDRAAIGAGATIVQMCGRFVPSHFSARREPPKHVLRAFSEVVMESVTVDCDQLVRMMEELLLAGRDTFESSSESS